jgi:hypothetical protein
MTYIHWPLISDKRKNLITQNKEPYDWRSHFSMDTNEVSQESLEKIIRKMLYLVRWFDIDTVSKSLVSNQFPVIDGKDIMKLPFQPALRYQKENLGDLYVGKFLHEIGALNCGSVHEHDIKRRSSVFSWELNNLIAPEVNIPCLLLGVMLVLLLKRRNTRFLGVETYL